ncbi:MAG: hypothetical protein A3H29_18405 [Acidobacteria bacterium RIFCSPLOWO2_02_FULL_67_21]|nr:MAG: hypothetical protein A3H29_18405 [Acidobacteria bacterium RIFCSPLOWO2_02_FULL_67_21]
MSLGPGTRLGPYEIQSALGAGGMGEVYRARDTRLGRDVAVKVLPATASTDPERLRRFEQEARAAAALSHPNILAVYDIGRHPSTGSGQAVPYIVSELLSGSSLRERIGQTGGGARSSSGSGAPSLGERAEPAEERDGLSVRRAVDYATQIARGLAAAHAQQITHRDLKPENIFVTGDGRVKILDFGIAKLTQATPALADASPDTTADPGTGPGLLLGTVGYMAPEQARGQTVDHRSDIFAFGAILYEMLAGQRAFAGATPVETLSAILQKDPPDLPAAERHIPPALVRIVERCLEKDPAARFQSTTDLAFALEALAGYSGESPAHHAPAPAGVGRVVTRERIAWVAIVVAAAVALLASRGPAATDAPLMRLELTTPPGGTPESIALSPDGRQIVYAAEVDGRQTLYLRSLDDPVARPLAGTDGASSPFWSPDGRSIAFVADNQLKRLDISGGAPQVLTANALSGGSWSSEGVILFRTNRGQAAGIYRISAAGGEAVEVTRTTAQQSSHARPAFLPDGNHFLYIAQAGAPPGAYVAALDAPEPRFLVDATQVAYSPSGHLLFVRQGTLYAQRFDAGARTLSGEPVPLAQQVLETGGNAGQTLSASDGGLVAFRAASGVARRQLAWFDRAGRLSSLIDTPDTAQPESLTLSPDGKQIAFYRTIDRNLDVWLFEVGRGIASRFTFDPAGDMFPIWSPDGDRVAFASNRGKNAYNLYQKLAGGAGADELLLDMPLSGFPLHWSPDGRYLLYRVVDPVTVRDLWALPLDGERDARRPFPVVNTPFEDFDGRFSPDGRWLAYGSTASGRAEIYVQPFPNATGRWQISTAGGGQPHWRRDGRELYYVAPDGAIVAVPIALGADARPPEVAAPVALFTSRLPTGLAGTFALHQYAVTADGQRFLIIVTTGEAATVPITLLVNWTAAIGE